MRFETDRNRCSPSHSLPFEACTNRLLISTEHMGQCQVDCSLAPVKQRAWIPLTLCFPRGALEWGEDLRPYLRKVACASIAELHSPYFVYNGQFVSFDNLLFFRPVRSFDFPIPFVSIITSFLVHTSTCIPRSSLLLSARSLFQRP